MGRAEPFRGQASDVCFSQSPWFNADEIPAESWGGYVVQIEEVRARRGVKFNKGKAREVELFLKFAGIEKELRVNVTIRRTLDSLIGPICADWFGKFITLFVQGGIDTSEGKKNGVRVKPSLPPQSAPRGQSATASEAERSAPQQASPASVESKFSDDVRAAVAEIAAAPGGADTLKAAAAAAGVTGKSVRTLTHDELVRFNAALPEVFRATATSPL